MDALAILGSVIGSLVVLVLPGLSWSLLFSRGQGTGWLARVLIAIGLSLVLMPLVVFWLNLTLNVGVSLLNVVIIALVLTAMPPVYLAVRHRLQR